MPWQISHRFLTVPTVPERVLLWLASGDSEQQDLAGLLDLHTSPRLALWGLGRQGLAMGLLGLENLYCLSDAGLQGGRR